MSSTVTQICCPLNKVSSGTSQVAPRKGVPSPLSAVVTVPSGHVTTYSALPAQNPLSTPKSANSPTSMPGKPPSQSVMAFPGKINSRSGSATKSMKAQSLSPSGKQPSVMVTQYDPVSDTSHSLSLTSSTSLPLYVHSYSKSVFWSPATGSNSTVPPAHRNALSSTGSNDAVISTWSDALPHPFCTFTTNVVSVYWVQEYSFSNTLSLPGNGQLMVAASPGSNTNAWMSYPSPSHANATLSPLNSMVGGRFTSTS